MDGNPQRSVHQRHHHQATTEAKHSGRPPGNAANPRQQSHLGIGLLVLTRCLLVFAHAHGKGQNHIDQRLHHQQKPAGHHPRQTAEQQRRTKGRRTDGNTGANRERSTAQVGYQARQSRGNDGKAAGGQSLMGREIQPEQQGREDQSTSDAQQAGQPTGQQAKADQQGDVPPGQHVIARSRSPACRPPDPLADSFPT